MIRGLYTAAAGMVTSQRRHDTATQNIANMNTSGYKQVQSVSHSFPEVLVHAMDGKGQAAKALGKMSTGVFAEESFSLYLQGDVIESGKPLDFALSTDLRLQDPATGGNMVFDGAGKHIAEDGTVTYQPQAFFTVRDAEGNDLYTRNGSFNVSADGRVLSAAGFQVLDAAGNPLTLDRPVDNIEVDGAGNLIDPATGQTFASLGITYVNNPEELIRDGNGVFHAGDPEAAGIRLVGAADNFQVRQGFLENSNVDATQVTVDLNAAFRAYEANQRVVQFYDSTLQKAVNEIGRV